MLKKDLNFIISVLQEDVNKQDSPIDWYSVLGFLQLHRVDLFFYRKAILQEITIPEQIEKLLIEQKRFRTLLCQKNRSYIERIGDAFEKRLKKYAFLKGSVLSGTHFEQVANKYYSTRRFPQKIQIYCEGERNGNDIDILVRQADLAVVHEILSSLGFRQGVYDCKTNQFIPFTRQEIIKRRMTRGETAPYILLTGDKLKPFVEVDINFSVDNEPDNQWVEFLLIDTVLQEGIRTLEQSKFFLHLVLHQYKESVVFEMWKRKKNQSLYKLLDLYLLLSNGLVSLGQLWHYCKDSKIKGICYTVLQDLADVFTGLKKNYSFVKFIEDVKCVKEQLLVYDYNTKTYFKTTQGIKDRYIEFDQLNYLKGITEND